MTVFLLISKYDKSRRDGEVDDWTSYDDIGAAFGGRILTAEEYQRTEDLYISAVELLAKAVGVDRFVLRHVFLNVPEPSWLGEMYDGRVVDLAAGLRLLRESLRDGTTSALLESGDVLRVAVDADFCLSVQIQESALESLAEIEKMGLYPLRVPCWAEEEEPAVSRPTDGRFWADVTARAAVDSTPTLILERQAQGTYGHRWYLVEDGGLPSVAGSVRRQSLVTAFFGVEIRWAARNALLRAVETLWGADDDPRVVIFLRSDEGPLRTLTCGEGVPLPSGAELPPGDEFGFFLWPDEGVAFTQAVVPGEDGRIAARWPDPWVL
ncbi:hypothetical protein ACIO1C_30285 [Streptomyces sp. NPDC087420]|uniref:hypothetical protein n=1 Tax=Streptomyces sp. NPDC087420 TaxID=3365785 RepID=UPI003838D3A7